jgi:hypothetical protein
VSLVGKLRLMEGEIERSPLFDRLVAKFLRQRVERLLDYLDEIFALQRSSTEKSARSLRVAGAVVVVIFLAIAFVLLFFVWVMSKEPSSG